MYPHCGLPFPLLALLYTALPAFTSSTTRHDPFHDIAIHVPKPPEPPVCCLRPVTPLEDTEEEVLLTFEEWKAKRFSEASKESTVGSQHAALNSGHKSGAAEDAADPGAASFMAGVGNAASALGPVTETDLSPERVAPHFRVPITDRFNYASMDCSARVHTAHKSAKSASSILASKKDRYMLSPCAAENQFVVVELCDDIRIDTVQLANYEFFSGVFKDFSVSVAKTCPTDPSGWVPAGTYKARNTRGVQSFHPPTSLSDFYRFIRIDFHSHYGNEYYCPLSLLRVYGLTHLEHWKWDMWESESRQRALEAATVEVRSVVPAESQPAALHGPSSAGNGSVDNPNFVDPSVVTKSGEAGPRELDSVSTKPGELSAPSVAPAPSEATTSVASVPTADSTSRVADESLSEQVPQPSQLPHSAQVQTPATQIHGPSSQDTSRPSSSVSVSAVPTSLPSSPASETTSTSVSTPPHDTTTSISTPPPPHSQTHVPQSQPSRPVSGPSSGSGSPVHTLHSLTVVPPLNTGGESIYRTIMNRLSAIEANTTLYARYVEEQIAGVREMMRRLGEDVGRLEGIGKAQAQMYQRSMLEFDRYRRRIDSEHVELMTQVSRLTDEVMLEKRLGIAQLCLLLAVLIFMALTRGSRGEVVHSSPEFQRSRTNSVREWGKRTLNLSGDWMNRFRSPSQDARPNGPGATDAAEKPVDAATSDRIAFPPRMQVSLSEGGVTSTIGVTTPSRGKRSQPRKFGSAAVSQFRVPRTPTTMIRSPLRTAGVLLPNRHAPSYWQHHARASTQTSTDWSSAAALVSPDRCPPVQRSRSGGPGGIVQSASMGSVIGPVPKSARRWARTAHLHEVKSVVSIRAAASGTITGAPSSLDVSEHVSNGDTNGTTEERVPESHDQSVSPSTNITLHPPSPATTSTVPAMADSGSDPLSGDEDGSSEDVFGTQVRSPASIWSPTNRKVSLTMHLARAGLSPTLPTPPVLVQRSFRANPGSLPAPFATLPGLSREDTDVSSEGEGEGDAWVDTDVESLDGAEDAEALHRPAAGEATSGNPEATQATMDAVA